MDRNSTPITHKTLLQSNTATKSLKTGKQRPSRQALAFIRQFARAYRTDSGIELILN